MQGAWKVGLLVVVAGALFFGVYWILGQSVFAPKTHKYFAEFSDAGGIATGASVMMAGVQIGKVGGVELKGPNRALVTMLIDDGVQIPKGSTVQLPTALIGIGDRQLNVVPPPEGWSEFESPGAILSGSIQSPLQSLMPGIDSTLQELNTTIASVRTMLESGDLRKSVDQLLVSTNQTVKQFGTLAAKLTDTVSQNQGTVRKLLANGNTIVANLGTATAKLASYVKSGKIEGQIETIMAEFQQTLDAGQQLIADMNALVTDPKMKQSFDTILANATKITESGTRLATNAEEMAANGVKITENVVAISEKVNTLADDAKDLFERLKRAVDNLPKDIKFPSLHAEADLMRESSPGRWRTDLNVQIPIAGQTIYIGLFDAFESNKINLQLGRSLSNQGTFRYGIYAGKPGIGVDYTLNPRIQLRGDLFGANDPRLDLRAKYDFGNGIFGWVGVDRIFRQNAPTIGVGIRR